MERSPISHWFGSGWDRVSVPLGVWGPWSPRLLTLVGADACRRCCDSRLGGVSSLLALGWLLSLWPLACRRFSLPHSAIASLPHSVNPPPVSHSVIASLASRLPASRPPKKEPRVRISRLSVRELPTLARGQRGPRLCGQVGRTRPRCRGSTAGSRRTGRPRRRCRATQPGRSR